MYHYGLHRRPSREPRIWLPLHITTSPCVPPTTMQTDTTRLSRSIPSLSCETYFSQSQSTYSLYLELCFSQSLLWFSLILWLFLTLYSLPISNYVSLSLYSSSLSYSILSHILLSLYSVLSHFALSILSLSTIVSLSIFFSRTLLSPYTLSPNNFLLQHRFVDGSRGHRGVGSHWIGLKPFDTRIEGLKHTCRLMKRHLYGLKLCCSYQGHCGFDVHGTIP